MDRALVRSCYHDGALDHHGMFDGEVDDFIDWCWQELDRFESTMHFVGNVLVDVAEHRGDAVAETYAIAHHQVQRGSDSPAWTSAFRYVDRFERRRVVVTGTTEWRIAERWVVGEWVHVEPAGQRRAFAPGVALGARDDTDPLWDALSRLPRAAP
jgi:hypothetical protein